jgi:hypothetical protein
MRRNLLLATCALLSLNIGCTTPPPQTTQEASGAPVAPTPAPAVVAAAAAPGSGPAPEPTAANAGSGDAPAASGSGEATVGGSAAAVAEPAATAVPAEAASIYNAAGSFEPLNDATRALVWGTVEDPVPEVLNATREDLENRHYVYCDELHLALFEPHLRGIRGAYMGVGSDQAYTLMGWMQAEMAWLTDYDPWIKQLHRVYHAFFEAAPTKEAFRDLWRSQNFDSSRALIVARFESDPDYRLMMQVFDYSHGRVGRRMARIATMAADYEIPTFITDDAMYGHVRGLVMGGRVRPLVANLLDDEALHAIGEVSRTINVPVRALYVSNAEDYWPYSDQFRQNMYDQFFDENSWFVRTAASKSRNGDYRYNVQDALNFQQWLQQPYVRRRGDVWAAPAVRDETDIPIEVLDAPPFDRE